MGKAFDLALIAMILTSVLIVMLDSIEGLHAQYGLIFLRIEWLFTAFFTLEYFTRIWCSPNRRAYILSVYGVVDLLAILPTYFAVLVPQAAPLLILRLVRILRIFRILRLLAYLNEANSLIRAMRRSARKIFVFFAMMIVITTIFGCLIYVVEGPDNGFNNIPKSIYWAIVTITTVGYGDVVPVTAIGRAISAVGMLTGYAIIAVPTGIITAELATEITRERNARNCTQCNRSGHDSNAHYCKFCGATLPAPGS
jgi:voltage-gated potassium channel